jgi:hypothetical protein
MTVGVKGIAELVDSKIENTDRAPECCVATITIHGLLVCLMGLCKLLDSIVCPAQ